MVLFAVIGVVGVVKADSPVPPGKSGITSSSFTVETTVGARFILSSFARTFSNDEEDPNDLVRLTSLFFPPLGSVADKVFNLFRNKDRSSRLGNSPVEAGGGLGAAEGETGGP